MNNATKLALVIGGALLIAVLGYYYVNRDTTGPSHLISSPEELASRNEVSGTPGPNVQYGPTGPGGVGSGPMGSQAPPSVGPDTPPMGAGTGATAGGGPGSTPGYGPTASGYGPGTSTGGMPPSSGSAYPGTQPAGMGPSATPPTTRPAVEPVHPVHPVTDPLPPPRAPEHVDITPPPRETGSSEYVIKSGETFGSIAKKTYGSETHWREIAQANPLVDPSKLKVGQKIRLPDSVNGPAPRGAGTAGRDSGTTGGGGQDAGGAPVPKGITYIVKPGDTLSSIARQYYHDRSLMKVILQANKDLKGSAANIKPGMKLVIPPAPKGAN
ncbi:MAG: LysM peptidoglycan-binding domain-containing protein [Planctomycetota bacterium]|nr:LysM peptidoglycan-binding domain-containing protein [Planctomycetota bacterium]